MYLWHFWLPVIYHLHFDCSLNLRISKEMPPFSPTKGDLPRSSVLWAIFCQKAHKDQIFPEAIQYNEMRGVLQMSMHDWHLQGAGRSNPLTGKTRTLESSKTCQKIIAFLFNDWRTVTRHMLYLYISGPFQIMVRDSPRCFDAYWGHRSTTGNVNKPIYHIYPSIHLYNLNVHAQQLRLTNLWHILY